MNTRLLKRGNFWRISLALFIALALELCAGAPPQTVFADEDHIIQGNVGIGTTSPGGKRLKVQGDADVTGTLTAGSFSITNLGTVTVTGTMTFSGVTTDITTGANEHLALMPNGTGNVGIGTTVPTEKLSVAGNIFLTGTRSEIYGTDRNHMIVLRGDQAGTANNMTSYYQYGGTLAAGLGHRFFTGGAVASQTEKMRISDNGIYMAGNVGIGTTSPGYKLHVSSGSVYADNYYLDGTQIEGISGRNYFKDTELSTGNGLRVGAVWGYYGIYAESGDVVVGSSTGVIRLQSTGIGTVYAGTYYEGGTALSSKYMPYNGINADTYVNLRVIRNNWNNDGMYIGYGRPEAVRFFNNTTEVGRFNQGNQTFDVYGGAYISGSVGIGATSPGAKLNVQGDIRVGAMEAINYTVVSPWTFASKPAGWYRFAQNSGDRANATFELRENADHSSLVLRVGTSYNNTGGSSLIVLNHNVYGSATFQQIRLLTGTTYQPQYLEVYVSPHNNDNQTFYAFIKDNLLNSGWSLINFTAGSIPGGYAAATYNVDNVFMAAQNGDAESLRVNRAGNVGIGITNPGQKLSVAGIVESTSGGFKFPDGTVQESAGAAGGWVDDGPVVRLGTASDNVGIGTALAGYKLDVAGTVRMERHVGINSLVLNDYQTVNPASNVFLYSSPNDRDSWVYLDSADTGSNWGIYHRQIDSVVKSLPANSVGFIGGGTSDLKSYISLANGTAYFKGNVGIGTTGPSGKLDVLAGAARTGTHGTTPSFYVTGSLSPGQTGPSANNIEFRHDNGTQGIGFGYNTIYQTGSNANQELNLLSRGSSPITLNAYPYSTGNVGIGTAAPNSRLTVIGGDNAIRGAYGRMMQSRDEWLRINDDDQSQDYHTNGIYMDGPGVGIQGGLSVGGSNLPAAGDINVNGFDIDMMQGSSGYIHRVGRISFDWTGGSYNSSEYNGIESMNYNRNWADSMALNSYNDITLRLDSNNNNGNSYLRVTNDAYTGGTVVFQVDQSGNTYHLGNVGIGTTGPTKKLDVYNGTLDNTAFQGLIRAGVNNSTESSDGTFNEAAPSYGLEFTRDWTSGGQRNLQAGIYAWGSGSWSSGLAFRTASTGPSMATRMVITGSTGRVGIGTLSPGEKLSVAGVIESTIGGIKFPDGSTMTSAASAGGWTDNGANVYLTTLTDYVGIGTQSPQRALHITQGQDAGSNSIFQSAADDRPAIALRGYYPEIDIISNMYTNASHGATLRLAAYDDSNRNTWKHWVIGTPGVGASWMDIGYAQNDANPHAGIAGYAGTSGTGKTIMRLQSNGNVGIGTTSPGYMLHVAGNAYANNYYLDGIQIEGLSGRNYFRDSEGAGNLRVGAAWGYPGIYAEAGDVVVGSVTGIIRLQAAGTGDVRAGIFRGGNSGYYLDPANAGNSLLVAGNVGIGTTGPSYKLDVAGTVRIGGFTGNNADEWPNVVWYRDTPSGWDEGLIKGSSSHGVWGRTGYGIHMDASKHFMFASSGWNTLMDIEGGSGRVYIKGNVGIGTTTPAVGLHVYNKNAFFDLPGGGAAERNFTIKHAGTAQIGFGTYPGAWTPALQIQNNNNSRYVWISPLDSASGGNARLVTGGSDFDIMPGNVQAATFTTGGNVGIGKTGPGYKLDVNGTVATYAEYPTITIDHPTSGGTAGIRLRSRSNFGSDIGYLLLQDDSANTLGSSAEDVRLTLGVYNDFYGGGGSHSDELWLQGGGRLVQNVGNWDAEMNSLIGGVGQVKTVGQAYEWRINNAAKMLMDISGKVGIGTTGPGYILDVNGTSGFRSIDKIGPGSNNPERGPWNVLWTAIGAGRAVYMDEEFASGSNSIGVYNNSGGNGVQHYWENGNGSQPNRSGKWLRIYNNGNATSPGYGGFVQTISSRRNATFVQRFRARLPSGYNLNIAENSQGTNNTSYWLTSTAGTGMWEEYIRVSHCGSGGTFSSGGHVYVTGPSSVFTWYLASCNVYEVDSPPGVFAGDVTVGGNLSVNGNLYAPIFYDSNDNGYYVDPNSTSNSALRMRGGALFGPNPSWGAYLYVGSNGNVSGTATVAVTSGNLHIDSASSGYGTYLNWYSRGPIYYGSGTRIAINGSSITSGSAYGFGNGAAYNNMNSLAVDTLETDGGTGGGGTLELNYYGGNEVHIGPSGTKPLRAAIMYDGNNGSYYVNPNDTSVLNVVQVNGYMLRGGHSTGYLAGSYNNIGANSSRSNPIYTIGTNYAPTDNSLNNMYGIGYTHRNFWGSDSNKPSGWGQYVAADGDIRVILSGSNGQIWSSGDIRSPIFYDSNNTGYYVDPNGTSNLYAVTDYTRAAFNLPRTYVNRRDITSDQNYWTGTNGWGTGYGTWDDAWKWGFSGVDIWGTSTGHPQGSGYIHAQGIISGEHYATSNGNRGYGWMMVGAANATENRYWLRGKWSTSTSGWVEMITTGNVSSYTIPWNTWIYNHYFGTDGAEYATIYYDTNDSGYYANPNGTSRLRQLNLTELYMVGGGWLRNYNRTGMYSQSYGGHFYWDSAAYIDLSNNNGMRFRTNTSYDSGLAGYVYHDGNGFGLLSADGNWRIRTQPGYQELYGTTYENSTQSYIYYDRNDTGYYIDPNSTSNTALRMRGGALFGPNSTWGAYLYIGTNGNVGGTATVAATNGNLHIDSASSGYGLYLNYYQSGPIWACNNNYIYDINDSAYYMDLNGTSRFNYMGRNYGYNWREYDWNNSGYWVDPNSCSRFYRLIRQQAYGWVEYDCNDNAYYVDPSGTSAFNDLRANIFYDRQNTGYYLDPNGSSRLNQIYYVDNLYSVYDRPQVIYDWNDSYYYIDLNSNGDAARFAGNIYVVTPESSSAWVRLGAAWNKPGVYSNQSLYLGSESMVVINDNNQENWYFDGDNFYSNGWGHIYSSSSNLHIDAYSGSIYLAYYYNTWVYVGNGNVGYLTIGSVRIQDNNDWFYICCLPNSRMWINGSLRVQGTLTVSGYIYKNGGGFQIDHPLDPANKVLVHSFVESPDMKNLYDGVVIIGENGESIIELPDWFEALNKDFRYQLTTIGKPGMSYVKEEIKDNKFTIAGDPGAKISWQVTGIRKDAYAEKHRIKVEEEKGSRDDLPKKGEYLTPEFYGEKE